MVKVNPILEKLQGPGVGFQLFQVFRYAFLLAASLFIPVFGSDPEMPDVYESFVLAGSAVSFFWVTGVFDAFVVRYQAVSVDERAKVLQATFGLVNFCALASAFAMYFLIGQGATLWFGYTVFLFFELAGFLLPMQLLVKGEGKRLAWYGLVAYGGYALIVAAGVGAGWTVESIFWVAAIWAAMRWGLTVILAKPWLGVGGEQWAPLGKLAIPITGVALLSQSAVVMDGYLAMAFFPDDFAAFRYGSKEFPLVLMLANALSTTFAGQIASGIRQDKLRESLESMKSNILPIIYFGFGVTILLLLLSDWVFDWTLGPSFEASVAVFDICLLFTIPRLLFPQTVVRGLQKGWVLTGAAATELAIKVGLSFLLMPLMGLAGLVMATWIGFVLEKALLAWYCRRFHGIGLAEYTPLGAWLAFSAVLLVTLAMKYLL